MSDYAILALPIRPLLLVLAAGALAACSGAATADLFSAGGTATASNGDPSPNGDGVTGDGAGPSDASASDGGVRRRDASVVEEDAAVDPDAGPPADAATTDAGPLRTLSCAAVNGTATCDVGAEICCKGGTSYHCETGACGTATNLAIPCDDDDDCAALGKPGTVCCLSTSSTGKPTEVVCRAQQDCDMNSGRHGLCDPKAADPCPSGGSCKLSTVTLPGYYVCF